MRVGIFAKTFKRPSLGEVFAAAKAAGAECVQFNFSSAGMSTIPEFIPAEVIHEIVEQPNKTGMSIPAISGTCNLIHPDQTQRARDIGRLRNLIIACAPLGVSVVTLCTGSRDATDMWHAHPENQSKAAWLDLQLSLEILLPVAQASGVFLGIEPEPANVINSASRTRQLLDEMHSPNLKIVFDAANLLSPDTIKIQEKVLTESFNLLGRDIVLAHAKDLRADLSTMQVAAGRGEVDYGIYLGLLKRTGFNGPLILHNLQESEAAGCVAFLQHELAAAD